MLCGIQNLSSSSRVEPVPPLQWDPWNSSHWITREVPTLILFYLFFLFAVLGPHCYMGSLILVSRGCSIIEVHRHITSVAATLHEYRTHGLQ